MRIIYIMRIVNQGKSADFSYNISWLGLWSYAEISLCLTVACALSLPKLLRANKTKFSLVSSFFSRIFSSVSQSLNLSFLGSSTEAKGAAVRTENHKGNGSMKAPPIELVFLTEPTPVAKPFRQEFYSENGRIV